MNVAETPFLSTVELPRSVQIEPVAMQALRSPALMSLAAFGRVLDQFPRLGSLTLDGRGEPLSHPRIFDMVRYAAARGAAVTLRSRLPAALGEERIEECVQSGLQVLEVVLDQADPRRALGNARRIAAAKRRLASPLPELRAVLVATRSNIGYLVSLLRLAAAHDLREVRVQHLTRDFARTRKYVATETLLNEDPTLLEPRFAELRAAAEMAHVRLELPQPRGRCDRPSRGVYLNYYGRAMPCDQVASNAPVGFGNMDREGVARVWSNDAYQAFRARLASDDPPEICKGCALLQG